MANYLLDVGQHRQSTLTQATARWRRRQRSLGLGGGAVRVTTSCWCRPQQESRKPVAKISAGLTPLEDVAAPEGKNSQGSGSQQTRAKRDQRRKDRASTGFTWGLESTQEQGSHRGNGLKFQCKYKRHQRWQQIGYRRQQPEVTGHQRGGAG